MDTLRSSLTGPFLKASDTMMVVRKNLATTAKDRREMPVYSIEEAADYLRIPYSTLYSWTIGRKKADGRGSYEPVLRCLDESRRLSFYDLVEAHILRAAVEKKVPLSQLRNGLAYLRAKHPSDRRPLLAYSFLTDGKYLLVGGMLGPKSKDREALLNASVHGQLAMTAVLEEHLKQLVKGFDDHANLLGRDRSKMPDTIYPISGQHIVSITCGIVSGRPVIEGTRVPTSIVIQRFLAGEDVKALAKDYGLPRDRIEAAIQYETAA